MLIPKACLVERSFRRCRNAVSSWEAAGQLLSLRISRPTYPRWVDFDPNAFQKYKPSAEVVGDGRIEYGEPFACEAGSDDVGRFSFSPGNGGVNLELSDFVPSCGLKVGPLTASVTQSDVSLVAFQGRQMGTMSGGGRLALDESNFARTARLSWTW